MQSIKNQRGFAMPLVLMVMLVASLLGTALWQYNMTEIKQVARDEKRAKAHYLARAGAEATIATWLAADFGKKPKGKVEKIYLKTDGEFVLTDPGPEKEGEVAVEVTEDAEGLTVIKATGKVDEITEQVTATSAPYADGEELDPSLYNKETGEITQGSKSKTATVDGKNVTVNYHAPVEGAVNFATEGKKLYVASNKSIELTARALIFNSPVNMVQAKNYDNGALILSAEYIAFNYELNLERFYYYSWFLNETYSYYGTVLLHVPEGRGYKLPGKSGTYGKVYFKNGFISEATYLGFSTTNRLAMTKKDQPTAYYFRERPEGIDLIKWHRGNYIKNEDYIEISDTNSVSMPQGSGLFFWSK